MSSKTLITIITALTTAAVTIIEAINKDKKWESRNIFYISLFFHIKYDSNEYNQYPKIVKLKSFEFYSRDFFEELKEIFQMLGKSKLYLRFKNRNFLCDLRLQIKNRNLNLSDNFRK